MRARWTGRWPEYLAILVFVMSIGASVALHLALREREQQTLQLHADTLARAIRDEVLSRTTQQILGQRRIAARLGDEALGNEAGWRADASRYQAHHPYYRAMAVLDPQLRLRWLESRGELVAEVGEGFPVDPQYFDVLVKLQRQSDTVVTRPFALPDGKPGISFFTPILHRGEGVGFLLAVLVIPDAFGSMLPEAYRGEVQVQVDAHGTQVFPLDGSHLDRSAGVSSRVLLDADDDGEGFDVELALSPQAAARMRSGMPAAVLGAGVLLSVLLALAGLLGANGVRQARALAEGNRLLRREIEDRERIQRELHHLATHDALTGLPNRSAAEQRLQAQLQLPRDGSVLAVLFVDLDQFKDINDTLGHQAGDQLLQQIPQRLGGVLQASDFLARQSGDEFLLLVERPHRDAVRELAQDLVRVMDAGFHIDGHHLFVSASIGVAIHPDAGNSVSDLVRNADTALFKAKRSGRNQMRVFTRELFAEVEQRLHLGRDIREALDSEQFRLVYQPIIDLVDGRLSGIEALLRWRRPDGQEIPTQDFVRIAEQTGLIGRLGEIALNLALDEYAAWARRGIELPWLAVNISGAQMRDAAFPEHLRGLLQDRGIAPAKLHLEITEEVLIENLARNRRILEDIHALGMRICVDDFGIGYSSLAYLKNFPVSVVKIDRSFVRDLARDREDQAITRTICSLALELGMETVAEGIEEPAQRELLRSYGCVHAQGYLYSRPLAGHALEALLAGHRPWEA